MRAVNGSAATPEEKTARFADIQRRAREIDAEYQTIKVQNRAAHGLDAEGRARSNH
jgi:hypothetical protein